MAFTEPANRLTRRDLSCLKSTCGSPRPLKRPSITTHVLLPRDIKLYAGRSREDDSVDTAKIVREIDAEIARLTSARNILTGSNSITHARRNTKSAPSRRATSTKRANRLSLAGRRKLSEMMKKRWAERRKKAAAKTK